VRVQCHAPAALYPREKPGTHCTGDWVGPRAGLNRCGKSRPHWDLIPDRPARSQSLYRLHYPVHAVYGYILKSEDMRLVSDWLSLSAARIRQHQWYMNTYGALVQWYSQGRNLSTQTETSPSDALSTSNLTRTGLVLNLGTCGEGLATNGFRHSMAMKTFKTSYWTFEGTAVAVLQPGLDSLLHVMWCQQGAFYWTRHNIQTCATLLHKVFSNTAAGMQLTIVLQAAGGLTLPEWTQTVYPEKMKSLAGVSLMLFTYTDVLKKLTGGEWVMWCVQKQILDSCT